LLQIFRKDANTDFRSGRFFIVVNLNQRNIEGMQKRGSQ
jgi:hypothetical protein